jgi:hypothetical protein
VGEPEFVSLDALRARARDMAVPGRLTLGVVEGDVRRMHIEPENAGAVLVQRFYRLSEPLYSLTGDHRDLTQLPVEGSRRVIGLPDLLKELGKLLTWPTKTAVQSAAPHAQRLGLAPGCYTPAAIGSLNEA